MKTSLPFAGALAVACVLANPRAAHAAERHFGFNYESSVLAPGAAEASPWSTARVGRDLYYSALEARLGMSLGLTRHLEGALYWNVTSVAEDIVLPGASLPSRLTSTELRSMSGQLKYRLSDPVADALGSALFVEGSYGPLQASFEGRLILDKQLGSLLLVGNAYGGILEDMYVRLRSIGSFGATLGAGYFATPSFVPGIELRSDNVFTGEFERSVLYAGPSLSWIGERCWFTAAVEPQLVALKGATSGKHVDLDQNEYVQVRLLFGLRL